MGEIKKKTEQGSFEKIGRLGLCLLTGDREKQVKTKRSSGVARRVGRSGSFSAAKDCSFLKLALLSSKRGKMSIICSPVNASSFKHKQQQEQGVFFFTNH